ncbi:uncharacterized protein LOC128737759 [Sabethes cyaneus]|uniref:uncharacterized protein LOC128737759 n=1 Tax=Sabethes cyaneus TaxID=53552 RepID=UPI00237E20F6|nr:uncharacterized protein LOC128737759 [Sabethes cyaneus]
MFRISNYSLLLFCYSSYYSFVWGLRKNATKTIKCLEDMLNQCPPNSICDDGTCICLKQFVYNTDFNEIDKTELCISRDAAQSAADNKSITFDKVFKEAPETHHILGGILIPISIVLVMLSAIVLTKKLHLLQKIRQMIFSSRARRPAYEDVVLVGYEQ